ncbi:hypothetical protein CCYS_06685 [Corynebacterium cystitidis DSM 20524]|uniref:DUF3558 family protein n=1 Tax=Corynebacterium cystitidis TaxID=35757 RepID=UPI000B94C899|nr:DUF3558 family protein [Corynebacterium cystitidis]WJY82268.1 hypothetical protein CCYS_06685 [Corynebacterium cystitidis DSM 20524]SNV77068.1 Uncharacterised protein [Corynebacterium cystitidis]
MTIATTVIAVCVGCSGVLSGCSAVIGEPDRSTVAGQEATTEHSAGTEAGADDVGETSQPVAPKADAFHFDSGTIQIGPFDPDELYPDVFDPCQEISVEEIEERGFTTNGITISVGAGTLLACALLNGPQLPNAAYSVYGNLATKQSHIDAGVYDHEVESDVLDGVFKYTMEEDPPLTCRIGIETERGTIGVIADGDHYGIPVDALCSVALQLLESFTH